MRALGVGMAVCFLAAGAEATGAKGDRRAGLSGASGKPMLAVVSLSDQHITVYGANGKLVEAPVSTGSTGYETPAGIFTVVQKKEHHHSNLYADGEMPFMQRITWTGIALHAGALPGHPASHGCIRLPMAFARQLFGMTDLGMRVVIVREDMRPSDISHRLLFKSRPVSKELGPAQQRSARLGSAGWEGDIVPGSAQHLRILETIASTKAAELDAATKRQRDARTAAARATSEAAAASRLLRAAQANVGQAEGALKAVEKQIESAASPEAKQRAESAKEKALAKLDELTAKLETARSHEQAKRDAAARADAEAKAATAARDLAAEAAQNAARSTLPVSVFVSRKTQRLYVRRGTHPVFEGPVAIRGPDKPIGTFVFTALDHLGTEGDMRWSVVAMYKDPTNIPPDPKDHRRSANARSSGPTPSDVATAAAALDRIVIGKETLSVIVGDAVPPGSSLIVSDEGPSRETGKDTDFVVVMSGEPQGALKVRQREPLPGSKDMFGSSPWGGSPFSSKRSPFFWTW